MTARTRQELIEKLAEIEHCRWADWQTYLHSKFESVGVGSEGSDFCIPRGYVQSLERQIATPYADLSEQEQQSDRDQVMRYWDELVAFVENWIERDGGFENDAVERAARWSEEMWDVAKEREAHRLRAIAEANAGAS